MSGLPATAAPAAWPRRPAVLAVVVAVLFLAAVIAGLVRLERHLRHADPLSSPRAVAINDLARQTLEDPRNQALTARIQALDTGLRQAWFDASAHLAAGAVLLVAGLAALLLAWRLAFPYRAPVGTGATGIPERRAARFILAMIALGLAIGAGAAVWKDAAGRQAAPARAERQP